MPDGATHFTVNALAGVGMTFAAAWYAPDAFAPVAVGSIIGAFITPDMDVDHTTHSEALLRKVPVVGVAFQAAWLPYALLHRHRGVSHWPVIGTLGRLAYMLVTLAVIGVFAVGWATLTGSELPAVNLPPLDWRYCGWLLAAWVMQDNLHIALDAVGKG